VGDVEGRGHQEIEAEGLLVTPGFVDVHTHYDGQATWDTHLAPSSWHGVTTAVAGNCGVGFAPVRPHEHDRLIELMEGVEDIPGTALHQGLIWNWESFPEYLDALEPLARDIDLGTQIAHNPVRLHVMGERAERGEDASERDISAMAEIVTEAVSAGALGFTTSRTMFHRTARGEYVPGMRASLKELCGITGGMSKMGKGVIQLASTFDVEGEVDLIFQWAAASQRPIAFSVQQFHARPQLWHDLLEKIANANAAGLQVRGQAAARTVAVLMSLETTLHPFMFSPEYVRIADLPLEERVARLRDEKLRNVIIDGARIGRVEGPDRDQTNSLHLSQFIFSFDSMYPLGDPPDYEPMPESSISARAKSEGRSALEVAYDLLLEQNGRAFLYLPVSNWAEGNLDAVGEILSDQYIVPALSDGGAHVGSICDVSFPTTMLQWWGRDRAYGRIPLEEIIYKQCRYAAESVGLLDRGVLASGYLADLNVIDFENLSLLAPEVMHDLPGGAGRLVQRASGYRHTIKRGHEIMTDGEETGELPGRLLRGPTRPISSRSSARS
jgi:N-acyl-D-aspartate/D-glutamate deacylase